MPGCCSPFAHAAERQFDDKKAAEEMARYRKNGPGPTTRLLQEGIAQSGPVRGTLLDVGSGIGSLTFGLLELGMTGAVAVDASPAYLEAARQQAERAGKADAIRFVHADFVSIASYLPTASVVTLDRVVCCYPSYDELLDAALRRAERCFAFSYPRAVWYVRVGAMIENGRRRLARNSFRTFVHPAGAMARIVERAGFELSRRARTWMWSVDVYVRRSTADAPGAVLATENLGE